MNAHTCLPQEQRIENLANTLRNIGGTRRMQVDRELHFHLTQALHLRRLRLLRHDARELLRFGHGHTTIPNGEQAPLRVQGLSFEAQPNPFTHACQLNAMGAQKLVGRCQIRVHRVSPRWCFLQVEVGFVSSNCTKNNNKVIFFFNIMRFINTVIHYRVKDFASIIFFKVGSSLLNEQSSG